MSRGDRPYIVLSTSGALSLLMLTHDFGLRRSVVEAVPVPTRQHSPCAFLLTKPPYESEANGRLRRLQDAQRVPEEVGPIRLVATELSTYKKSVRWTVVERERSFLEVLCGATEEPTSVCEIFHARSKRKC